MLESGSHVACATSLRTMALRLVRKTISWALLSVSTTVCALVVGGVVARAHERARADPRAVGAALVAHGSWGDAAGDPSAAGMIVGALPGDAHQGRGRGQEDGGLGPAGGLRPPRRPAALRSVSCRRAGKRCSRWSRGHLTWSPTAVIDPATRLQDAFDLVFAVYGTLPLNGVRIRRDRE